MSRNRMFGVFALAGFLSCVILANYSITHWGTVLFPGGPHTVTIGPWTAPSGVLFVGISFSLRDFGQSLLGKNGKWWTLAAIIVGACLSYLIAPSLAFASFAAFLAGEGFDLACYTPLVERGRVVAALVASNTVGAAVDTTVFLWLAFHSLEFWSGQFWLKFLCTAPFLLIVIPMRRRMVTA